jgi:hypothetical protein
LSAAATLTRPLGFGFERTEGKEDWWTPPEMLHALGDFDLDPCAPLNRLWDTAKRHYTINDNGLSLPWVGRVWLNPPYGSQTETWVRRLSEHGDGIALIFARTETATFFPWVWERAAAVMFLRGRVRFYDCTGKQAEQGIAPSVLVAYGAANVDALQKSGFDGRVVRL